MKKSNVRFAQLRAFFDGMGFCAKREKKGWRIEHAPTGTVFVFRPYRANGLVYAPDLFLIRSQLDARGMVAHESFDESLTQALRVSCRTQARRRSIKPAIRPILDFAHFDFRCEVSLPRRVQTETRTLRPKRGAGGRWIFTESADSPR